MLDAPDPDDGRRHRADEVRPVCESCKVPDTLKVYCSRDQGNGVRIKYTRCVRCRKTTILWSVPALPEYL